MLQIGYIALAAATVLIWTPALLRFYRTWKERKNPISLAICAVIMLVMWESLGRIWVVTEQVSNSTALTLFTILTAVVGVFFNLSFRWANTRFRDERR